MRLKQAATLLADKHHNITEVAALTGFTNTTYFSTSFKEMFGISPSAYMERYQNEESGESSENEGDTKNTESNNNRENKGNNDEEKDNTQNKNSQVTSD